MARNGGGGHLSGARTLWISVVPSLSTPLYRSLSFARIGTGGKSTRLGRERRGSGCFPSELPAQILELKTLEVRNGSEREGETLVLDEVVVD